MEWILSIKWKWFLKELIEFKMILKLQIHVNISSDGPTVPLTFFFTEIPFHQIKKYIYPVEFMQSTLVLSDVFLF